MMKRIHRLAFTLVLTLLSPILSSVNAEELTRELTAPGIKIVLTTSDSSLSSAETLELRIAVEVDRDAVFQEVLETDSIKDWLVLRQEFGRPILRENGGRRWLRTLYLAPVTTGKASFEGLHFKARSPGQYETVDLPVDDLFIQVKSLLPADHKLDKMKDIDELTPASYPASESEDSPWAMIAFLGLIPIAAFFIFKLWHKLKSANRPKHSVAKALKHFEQSTALAGPDAYRELMTLFRSIINEKQNFNALSLSASEMRTLLSSISLPEAVREELECFLRDYDRVQFSGESVTQGVGSERLNDFLETIEKLAEIKELK